MLAEALMASRKCRVKENKMGYLEEEFYQVGNYSGDDVQIWNAGSIYYDDEIVEYQGKRYIALRKTSTDIPGRCKAGIWKVLTSENSESAVDFEDYSYSEEPIAGLPVKENDEAVLPFINTPIKKVAEPVPPIISLERSSVKPVNKPLAKKQTLKERQDEQKESSRLNETSLQEERASTMPGKMMAAPTDQHIVNEILKEMEFRKIKGFNVDEQSIVSNLILPQNSKEDSKLTWGSSHPEIISVQGKVNRPLDGVDVCVNLSVTASKNKTSATRFFTLWVKALEKSYSDKECVDIVCDLLDFDQIKGPNSSINAISHDLELLTQGLYNTQILWASKNFELLDERGRLNKKILDKDTPVRLYAIITKGDTERLKYFDLSVVAQ